MEKITNKKFDLDRNYHFSNDIKKEDYLKIALSSGSIANLNKAGPLRFQSSSPSPLDICNAILTYKIKIDELKEGEDITLENNFFPRMFSQMSLKLGTSEVETIEYPGEVSSILNFVMTDYDYKKEYGTLSGWIPDISTGDTTATNTSYDLRKKLYNKGFEGSFPLKNLFGFLQCYNRIIFLISLEISLNRIINNDEIFYGAAPNEAKLTIEDMELWIPQITLNPLLEVKLLERLNTNKDINVSFLNRISQSIDISNQAVYNWSVANLSNRPRYIFVAFKNSTVGYQENNSKFIQYTGTNKIKSIRVQLNNSNYPDLGMVFDAIKNHQLQPYNFYIEMCKRFNNSPQLNYLDFKDLYSIFCFDVSAQDERLASNGCDVTIHITKDTGLNVKCFCVILEEKTAKINLNDGKMHLFSS